MMTTNKIIPLKIPIPYLTACLAVLTAGSTLAVAVTNDPASTTADLDRDGMSDQYELFYGLNPTDPADALLDYDRDRLINLYEHKMLTDPFHPDTDRDGFPDAMDAVPISRSYIDWGAPKFTDGDFHEYARPDWVISAYKTGGIWLVNPVTTQSAWHVESDTRAGTDAGLAIELDRKILTNNLVYAINFWDHPKSALHLDLLDAEGKIIADDLFGNLLSGRNVGDTLLLDLPTAKLPDAATIYLRRGFGQITVFESLLYIDEDRDGLDADQERQIGTSDYRVDSNGDGTNDFDSCFNALNVSTNAPVPPNPPAPPPGPDPDEDADGKTIYVDQSCGNDTFTGRAPAFAVDQKNPAIQKGPKKTVRAGLAIAGNAATLVIKPGNYNEDLNISGKNIQVRIEGNVKL